MADGARQLTPPPLGISQLTKSIERAQTTTMRGTVREITGLIIRAAVPDIAIGELVEIHRKEGGHLLAEAVGFRADHVILMPLGTTDGIAFDSRVVPLGRCLTIQCGPGLAGRVLDGLGQPIDDGPDISGPGFESWAVDRPAPHPLKRPRISRAFPVGVRVIDSLMTIGEGQRVGLFAGSGVGKSSLLGQIARTANTDRVVICLVGERGRELRDFIEEALGTEGLARSVVVCATSDAPAIVRLKAASVGTAIAEYFRDQGEQVLLLMDSVTRVARAQREVGLAAGEPPTRHGYPPSVFSLLPRLLERTGRTQSGSITALYSVLVPAEDMEEPIADELRAILDGHIVLSRALASRGHWPAVDVLRSLSRLMNVVATPAHVAAATEFRRLLAAYEEKRDLVLLDAYTAGSDPTLDDALELIDEMEGLVTQELTEASSFEACIEDLCELMA